MKRYLLLIVLLFAGMPLTGRAPHTPAVTIQDPGTDMFGIDKFQVFQQIVGGRAVCEAQVTLRNSSGKAMKLQVKLLLRDADGYAVVNQTKKVKIPAHHALAFRMPFTLEHPHLWNGPSNPYLYMATLQAGDETASVEVAFRPANQK